MNAPFFTPDSGGLILAFIIGSGFGFFLERAGFGSANKLAAQFFFTDLTVFKVMFTAIITAMLGLFWLTWLGLLDLSQVYVSPTYIIPQIVGGLIFGVGFVMGGYCPGTACISASTGGVDALFHIAGMLSGILLFGEFFEYIENFFYSTSLDVSILPQYFNISYGLLIFIIIIAAITAFYFSGKIENRFNSASEKRRS